MLFVCIKLQEIWTILLVEDSADNRLLISRLLNLEGATVDTAVDGVDGVQKALSGNHDLVLMDIQMPRMDGHAAVRKLRSSSYNKPVLALTAHAFREERERCLADGFNDHLSKPVNRALLTNK